MIGKVQAISVSLGCLAEPLAVQLAAFDLNPATVAHWEKDREAINRLRVRGVITERESDKADERLFKAICKNIRANA